MLMNDLNQLFFVAGCGFSHQQSIDHATEILCASHINAGR